VVKSRKNSDTGAVRRLLVAALLFFAGGFAEALMQAWFFSQEGVQVDWLNLGLFYGTVTAASLLNIVLVLLGALYVLPKDL